MLASPAPKGEPRGNLVVCPVTLLGNWDAEARKLLPPQTKVLILNGAKKTKTTAKTLATYDLVVTAYRSAAPRARVDAAQMPAHAATTQREYGTRPRPVPQPSAQVSRSGYRVAPSFLRREPEHQEQQLPADTEMRRNQRH